MNTREIDGRSLRAVEKRRARRSDILGAAIRLFSSRGFYATSISDLIKEAGISRGTFYLYFDSKEALFLDLMDVFAKRIMDVVEIVDPAGPDPVQKIYQNVRRIVDVVFNNRELAVIVFRETYGLDSGIDQKLNKLYGFLREMVEGALSKGASWGIIRPVNEQLVTTALIGAIKEVFYHHLVVEPHPVPDRDAFTTSLFEFSTRGLLSV
ncbi:MAG: TetR/AcrR family transcriptional regulator [Deltaproteobacteria bacterium]|nr:TetR/AcrR family transcriptional regulator [Deltaproteobacteria bacterium]